MKNNLLGSKGRGGGCSCPQMMLGSEDAPGSLFKCREGVGAAALTTSTCSSRWRWRSSEERSVQPLCSYGLNSFSSHIYESIVNSPVALDASNYWLWYSCSFTASLEELPLWCFQRCLHSCPRMVVMCSGRCIVWFLIFLKAKCFVSLEHFHSRVSYRQLSIQCLEGLRSVWVEAGGVNGAHHLCRIPLFLGQPWGVGVLRMNTHPSRRNHCREGQRAPGEVCWLLGRAQKCWMSGGLRAEQSSNAQQALAGIYSSDLQGFAWNTGAPNPSSGSSGSEYLTQVTTFTLPCFIFNISF